MSLKCVKTKRTTIKPFDVVIAGDLGGETVIQVDLVTSKFGNNQRSRVEELKQQDSWGRILTLDTYWHRKLMSAQNTLFCRELFALMSAEGVSGLDDMIEPIVLSDEIHYSNLFGFSLRLKLLHVAEADTKFRSIPVVRDMQKTPLLTESKILEHSLAQMLLNRMRDFANPDLPVPACGPVGLKIFRRKMAIQAKDRRVWKQGLGSRTLTAELVSRSTALILHRRCLKAAESLSCLDIQLSVHDCCFTTSWRNITIKISLTTPGFDMYNRSNCSFNVSNGKVTFLTKDFVTPANCEVELDCRLLYMKVVRQHAVVLQYLLKSNRFEVVHYAPVALYYNADENVKSESFRAGLRYAIALTENHLTIDGY
ncbi:mediator of RNA polymerase II transcription subunit 17-like isoform X1 [Paramacrobiotus metropolitanus]|uniref:mediator of RNA polymerase II transcription subunit 17-like isoform X1 n=2 Tax=Paramacrobiotus metropolitanus TaxID=2943436 RepID=UPI002445AD83|nr:mediator of RNA polymerase II transcription subunit 17-like isoform X1 [Paramacrobiotus metropolitanus]